MFNLSLFRYLLPPNQRQTLESALAQLQGLTVPAVAAAPLGERIDADNFNAVQQQVVAALQVLYTEIDAVEVILRQAAQRCDSQLTGMATAIDGVQAQTTSLLSALTYRDSTSLYVPLTTTNQDTTPLFMGDADPAAVLEYGVGPERAGRMLQSSYSGIPAAAIQLNTYTVTGADGTSTSVPCRLGIPLMTAPTLPDLSVLLNEDNSTYWSEDVLTPNLLQADPAAVSWLTGTTYRTGAAVQLRVDFEILTRVSKLELVPFAPFPITILAVSADGVPVWQPGDTLIQQNGTWHLIFPNDATHPPVMARTFLITLAQEHARQIVYGTSQQQAQDVRYWQQAATANTTLGSALVPASMPFQQSTLPQGDSLPGAVWTSPLDTFTTSTSTMTAMSSWDAWAQTFPRDLASRGIVLPAEQQQMIGTVAQKCGRVAELLATLATPVTAATTQLLRYEYTYGLRQLNFVYEEYETAGRFVSAPLQVNGELRQIKADLTLTPPTATITGQHAGELTLTGTFVNMGNTVQVTAGTLTQLLVGMTGYLESYPNVPFTLLGINGEILTLDRSQQVAFPQQHTDNLSGVWYFSSPETLQAAQGNVTMHLALRDDDSIQLPVCADAWTMITPQTEIPVMLQNPARIAATSTGDVYVLYYPEAANALTPMALAVCTSAGLVIDLPLPGASGAVWASNAPYTPTVTDLLMTDIVVDGADHIFCRATDPNQAIYLFELCGIYATDTQLTSAIQPAWAEVLGVYARTQWLSYPAIHRGLSVYSDQAPVDATAIADPKLHLLLQYCSTEEPAPTLYGNADLSRSVSAPAGTQLVAQPIGTDTPPYADVFPVASLDMLVTSVDTAGVPTYTYYLAKCTSEDATVESSWPNGIYSASEWGGLSSKPLFSFASPEADAGANGYDAFADVRAALLPDTTLFAVTETGDVLEANPQTFPAYSDLAQYPFSVTSWDTAASPAGLLVVGDQLYVVDKTDHCVKVFNLLNENVLQYAGWVGYGEDVTGQVATRFHLPTETMTPKSSAVPGGFFAPEYITTDATGNIYVSDTGNHRIQKFDPSWNFKWWLGQDAYGWVGLHTAANATPAVIADVVLNAADGSVVGTGQYTGFVGPGSAPLYDTGNVNTQNLTISGWSTLATSMTPGAWYVAVQSTNDGSNGNTDAVKGGAVRGAITDNNGSPAIKAEIPCAAGGGHTMWLTNVRVATVLETPLDPGKLTGVTFSLRIEGAGSGQGSSSSYAVTLMLGTGWSGGQNANFDNAVLYPFTFTPQSTEPWQQITVPFTGVTAPLSSYSMLGLLVAEIDQKGPNNGAIARTETTTTATYIPPIAVTTGSYENYTASYAVAVSIGAITPIPVTTSTSGQTPCAFESPRGIALISGPSNFSSPTGAGDLFYVVEGGTTPCIHQFYIAQGSGIQPDQLCLQTGGGFVASTGFINIIPGSAAQRLALTGLTGKSLGLNAPAGIAFLRHGDDTIGRSSLFVADAGNNRIVRFPAYTSWVDLDPATADVGGTNTTLGTLGVVSSGSSYWTNAVVSPTDNTQPLSCIAGGVPGAFDLPTALTIDADDHLYVLDSLGIVQVFDLTLITGVGTPTCTLNNTCIEAFGAQGNGAGQFDLPHSLYCDPQGRLYISDSGNDRLQYYSTASTVVWDYQQVALGDGTLPRDMILTTASVTSPNVFLCQGDGYVSQYTLTQPTATSTGTWGKDAPVTIGGGLTALCAGYTGTMPTIYAASQQGYLYKVQPNGAWEWIRSAPDGDRLTLLDIQDTFTATNPDGTVALSQWPFTDWEAIYTYQYANAPGSTYNPNSHVIPVMPPCTVTLTLSDGTQVPADVNGTPWNMTGRTIYQEIPSSVNAWSADELLAAVTPYLLGPVTIEDMGALGNYSQQLRADNVLLPLAGSQTSLEFSQLIGTRIFKSQYRDWLSDPQYKLGILWTDSKGAPHLYYADSATHQVSGLPQIDLIPREGMVVFRTALTGNYTLTDPVSGTRSVAIAPDQLQLVAFDFFAPDAVVPQYASDGTIARDANGEFLYTPIDSRAVPFTANYTDYLGGMSPDLTQTPYNAAAPINDPSYCPVYMYVLSGKTLQLNATLDSTQVQQITVQYKSLALHPRLIIDLQRNTLSETTPPIVQQCDLLIGRILS